MVPELPNLTSICPLQPKRFNYSAAELKKHYLKAALAPTTF